jgi:hypothetical protein
MWTLFDFSGYQMKKKKMRGMVFIAREDWICYIYTNIPAVVSYEPDQKREPP